MTIWGVPGNTRLSDSQVIKILEDNSFPWEYNDNGGIRTGGGNLGRRRTFRNTTLKTITDYLGY